MKRFAGHPINKEEEYKNRWIDFFNDQRFQIAVPIQIGIINAIKEQIGHSTIKKAKYVISSQKSNKNPDSERIPVELLNTGGEELKYNISNFTPKIKYALIKTGDK